MDVQLFHLLRGYAALTSLCSCCKDGGYKFDFHAAEPANASVPGLVALEIDVDAVNATGLHKISDKKAISVPFIKKRKKENQKNPSQTEVVAPCGSVMGCEGRFHASWQSTASTRQPLSISASKAVPLFHKVFLHL